MLFWFDFEVDNEYKAQVAQACEKCFSPEIHAKVR